MKKLGLGCGIVALLLAVLITGLIIAWPRIFKSASGWVQKEMKEQADQARFEAAWTPPTPEPGEAWFPEDVAGWKRATAAPMHDLPELSLTKDGYTAAYALNGQRIEVKAVPVTDLEKEGLMARAHAFKPLPESRGSTSSFLRGNTLELKYGDRERVYCRSLSECFVFMHTLDGADIGPFADAWLHAIDTQPRPAPPAPPAPEAPR